MSNENNSSDVTAKDLLNDMLAESDSENDTPTTRDLLNDILAENTSNDTPVKNTLAKNTSNDIPASHTPVKDTLSESDSENDTPTTKDLNDTPTTKDLNDTPTTKDLNDTPTTKDLNDTPTTKDLNDTPTTKDLNDTPTTKDLNDTPTTKDLNDTPTTKDLLNDTPTTKDLLNDILNGNTSSDTPTTKDSLDDSPTEDNTQDRPEIILDADSLVDSSEPSKAKIESLTLMLRLEKLKSSQFEEKLKHAIADYQNLRRKTLTDVENGISAKINEFALDFLKIYDDFTRAKKVFIESQATTEGLNSILKNMDSVLNKYNIRPIDALGEIFDPHLHEAISVTANPDLDDNTIIQELRRGYTSNGIVIRPTLVEITKKE